MPPNRLIVDKPFLKVGCSLGEGPVYDAEASVLHFVDILESKVYHLDLITNKLTFDQYPIGITSIVLRRKNPKQLAGTALDGFVLLTPDSDSKLEYLARPIELVGKRLTRFNDGACDRSGRYYAGTVYSPDDDIPGKLFRYDPSDGSCVVVDEGPFTDSNGIGWSVDEKVMYFTDSMRNYIYAYDFDSKTGDLSNRRVLVDAVKAGYGPESFCDGLCVDDEGGIWSARWNGSCIVRFTSSGEVDFELYFPTVWRVTSCCFGGPNLDQLYVTSAQCGPLNGDANLQREYYDSGDLFVVDLSGKYRGIPRYSFNG
ncbi:smp-30 gluconolaconase lre domain protein [Moniliophthora roreri MCA 2997]|uniref:Smp-30 gluconolaconase lre domain protein n=1 Tax=Moniliophthora roreri (strain MCA 2997) TaxID=1381753 RepID=V2Y0K0_MONRO|nr:smp-30 gluconolaconase lre domain protein [Moniliophthora roreri MCA 2997]